MNKVMIPDIVNGIKLDALNTVVEEIRQDPARALVRFAVSTRWMGQTCSKARVTGYELAGEKIARTFEIAADEPFELLGTNTAPNPQELLMAAVNACMAVGYVAGAALRGIRLETLEIETTG